MGTIPPELGQPYRAILDEKWDAMNAYYKEHTDQVLFPLTARRDTALHMAVFSNKKKPVNDLLDILNGFEINPEEDKLIIQNAFGMTPLHEAATCGNYEAVKLLIEAYPELLYVKNVYGETPLFRAAVFGHTKILDYLAKQPGQIDDNKKLLEIHRVRPDTTSILHVAVQGEHFDTALLLLRMDESLGEAMDDRGITALHLLANLPSAFKSSYPKTIFKSFIYLCKFNNKTHISYLIKEEVDDGLPEENDDYNEISGTTPKPTDLESGHRIGNRMSSSCNISFQQVMKSIKLAIFQSILAGWPFIGGIRADKRRHDSALEIAKLLIKKDASLNQAMKVIDYTKEIPAVMYKPLLEREKGSGIDHGIRNAGSERKENDHHGHHQVVSPEAPLLTATSRGITEIVHEILNHYPQAIEYHNDMGQNILHVAVMHRRKQIFNLIKRSKIPLSRMYHAIDSKGFTLLHHVADTRHYTGGTMPGPAFQLQEELQWFQRIRKIVPSHYIRHSDKVYLKSPRELFKEKHKNLLLEAQKWTKETSQSCSAVAVLVATVVFAAVYTVPGGSTEKGVPVFLHSPYFMFFTIMDVMALASSLTSVVMFLSILTSPFEYEDFLYSLPRKLTFGFTLLFFSVMATMLAFAATIILVVRTSKDWTTSLITVTAFLPVSVFLLMQMHLYAAFISTLSGFFKELKKAFPFLKHCRSHKRKQR